MMYLTENILRKIEDESIRLNVIRENNPVFKPESPPVELVYNVLHCRVTIRIFSSYAGDALFINLMNIEHTNLTEKKAYKGDLKPYTQKLFSFLKEECVKLIENEPTLRLRYIMGDYQMNVSALQYG